MSTSKTKVSKSPFKDKALLIASIQAFLNRNSAMFSAQGSKISEFFEMCCYNDVVEFYRSKKFSVTPLQLGPGKEFIYKLKANGSHENFSFFEVVKNIRGKDWSFQVHHNLALECAKQPGIFYVADVAVVTSGAVKRQKVAAYNQKRSFCEASQVQTFFEVKHMSPFPELLFSFTGLISNFLLEPNRSKNPVHIAPSILISGNLNNHTGLISQFLASHYKANVVAHLFARPSSIYSMKYSKLTIGSLT